MPELTPEQRIAAYEGQLHRLRNERADIAAVLMRTSYIRKVAKEKADRYTLSPLYAYVIDCWGLLEEIEGILNAPEQREGAADA
jgi:hypothetical protein